MRTVEIPLGEDLILKVDNHTWTVRLKEMDLNGPGVKKSDYLIDSREALNFEDYLRRYNEVTLVLTFDVAEGVIRDNTIEGEVTKIDGRQLLE